MTDRTKNRGYFIFPIENSEDLEELTVEEKGMMLDAMIAYTRDATEPNFQDKTMRIVWKIIRRCMVSTGAKGRNTHE